MAFGFGVHTSPDVFIPLLNDYLATELSWDRSRVYWLEADDQIHIGNPPADPFLVDYMPDFNARADIADPGGKANTPFAAMLVTAVYYRINSQVQGLTSALREAQMIAAQVVFNQVLTALQQYYPANGSGNLFLEPMRIKGYKTQTVVGYNSSRWNLATMNWDVQFVQNLGVSY